jgi:hypothetical protein
VFTRSQPPGTSRARTQEATHDEEDACSDGVARLRLLLGIALAHLALSGTLQATLANDGSCHWEWCKSGDSARLDAANRTYVARCTEAMESSLKLSTAQRQRICSCVVTALEEEFLPEGWEGYRKMMEAEPNPQGTAADQRLATVLSSCVHQTLGAVAEPDAVIKAASLIDEQIQFADQLLLGCQNADPPDVATYLGLMVDYHDATMRSLERRISTIIDEESRRHGTDFAPLLARNFDEAERTVDLERAKDQRGFVAVCHGLALMAERHLEIFQPFRERFLEQMRLIDAWR